MAPSNKPAKTDSMEAPQRRAPFLILPSIQWPFRQRSRIATDPNYPRPASPTVPSSADTTPATSPSGIHRALPDIIRCRSCATELAYASQIISKGFTGRQGRAYLVSPPKSTHPPSSHPRTKAEKDKNNNNLHNIRVGKVEGRALVTGWHEVADISCRVCGETLGWKYVDAKDEAQKYKVGKFILETTQTLRYSSWEDASVFAEQVDWADPSPARVPGAKGKGKALGEEHEQGQGSGVGGENETQDCLRVRRLDAWTQEIGDTGTCIDTALVEFDSQDEDECEELFAGIWDPVVVARRRSRRQRQRGKAS